jgi:hypothetical protein
LRAEAARADDKAVHLTVEIAARERTIERK